MVPQVPVIITESHRSGMNPHVQVQHTDCMDNMLWLVVQFGQDTEAQIVV